MMDPNALIELWRERAEEARTTAEQMQDFINQTIMETIAEAYERLALRVETELRRGSNRV